MKTIIKIAFALLASILVFTACSKSKDDAKPIAKEITAAELYDYYILEEYTPKPEHEATQGTKPILYYIYLTKWVPTGGVSTFYDFYTIGGTKLSYSPETGITRFATNFGDYELSRDDQGQIIVLKSNHDANSTRSVSKYYTSSHIQLVKRTFDTYDDLAYKEISGTGFYRFTSNKWGYRQGSAPPSHELTWNYSQDFNMIWHGYDGGSAGYYNNFFILPKGNGWKGQHKDKPLLIVNTLTPNRKKAVGDIGVYTTNYSSN